MLENQAFSIILGDSFIKALGVEFSFIKIPTICSEIFEATSWSWHLEDILFIVIPTQTTRILIILERLRDTCHSFTHVKYLI